MIAHQRNRAEFLKYAQLQLHSQQITQLERKLRRPGAFSKPPGKRSGHALQTHLLRRYVQNGDNPRPFISAERIEKQYRVGNPLRGLRPSRPEQQAVALFKIDPGAQQLGHQKPQQQHPHQPAKEGLRQQAHHGTCSTGMAST
ncbi:MAG: hypothetical protein BWY57_03199 [Betaproteobacteria bacterium ADurb.Bin341]|nr:MAG: hypothetical protein BWY57_03199 [Betaproteobacteria bacterium ADurb.Bin341]